MNPDVKAFQKNNDEIAAAQDIKEILQAKQNLDNTLRSQEITRDTYLGLLKYINERLEYMDGEYDKTQLDPIGEQISDNEVVGELTRIDHEADGIYDTATDQIQVLQSDIEEAASANDTNNPEMAEPAFAATDTEAEGSPRNSIEATLSPEVKEKVTRLRYVIQLLDVLKNNSIFMDKVKDFQHWTRTGQMYTGDQSGADTIQKNINDAFVSFAKVYSFDKKNEMNKVISEDLDSKPVNLEESSDPFNIQFWAKQPFYVPPVKGEEVVIPDLERAIQSYSDMLQEKIKEEIEK